MSASSDRTLVVCVVPSVETEQQALGRAKLAMEKVVEAASRPVESFSEVDYFEGGTREFLTPYWGDYPVAAPLRSDEGHEIIEEALSEMDQAFKRNLESVKEILEWYSDEQIQQNEELIRDSFLSLGAYVGQSVRVYGDNGRPLRSRQEFNSYIESDSGFWVVPVVARR